MPGEPQPKNSLCPARQLSHSPACPNPEAPQSPAAGTAHLRARRSHAGSSGASAWELKVRAKAAGTAGGGARRRLFPALAPESWQMQLTPLQDRAFGVPVLRPPAPPPLSSLSPLPGNPRRRKCGGPIYFFSTRCAGLWSCKGLALWRENLPVGAPRDSRARGEGRARGLGPPSAEPPRRGEGQRPPAGGEHAVSNFLVCFFLFVFNMPKLDLFLTL